MITLIITAAVAQAGHPMDVARNSDLNFDSNHLAWNFRARAKDSANQTIVHSRCRSGNACASVAHWGRTDWVLTSPSLQKKVSPGEIWKWSAWVWIDSLPGAASLGFIARKPSGEVISSNMSSTPLKRQTRGWSRVTADILVPPNCADIQAQLSGWGPAYLLVDEVSLAKKPPSPLAGQSTTISNDSLIAVFSSAAFAILLVDRITNDTVQTEPSTVFTIDSVQRFKSDSLLFHGRYDDGPWSIRIGARLHGGELRLQLHADSGSPLQSPLPFPGPIGTKRGQKLAMPRGTGITAAVTETSAPWSYNTAKFWEWQVSMGLTGATDGTRGFVVSLDQPWDAQMNWKADHSLLRPHLFQAPAKSVWGHDRSLLIAPLRGGGWAEMAQRHHARQIELGRFRNWKQKIASNPNVTLLRGAVDFWVVGNWNHTGAGFFDTLRFYGTTHALINWTTSWSKTDPSVLDTLASFGFLASEYTQYSGALLGGSTELDQEALKDGIAENEDGSTMNSDIVTDAHGNSAPIKTISIKRQKEVLENRAPEELKSHHRNGQFLDVILAANQPENYSPRYPSNRTEDIETRIGMLSFLKDTCALVVGAEQTRDVAHAVVDYGEGPMSIAFPKGGWADPMPPRTDIDSLSFDPSRRVPLLCLSSHDGFAPTWYTGDGQSKTPARWDAKDAWNALYGTMALIAPRGRAMWDSLRPRYLRSILSLGAAHDRYGFEAMTAFTPISEDWHLQRTEFGNGWKVLANLGPSRRVCGNDTLPGYGYIARAGREWIGRIATGGRTTNFVRISDRWYFEPEDKKPQYFDGILTAGAVSMVRSDDTTIQLAFIGDQASISILPTKLPWKSPSLKAYRRGSDNPVEMEKEPDGSLRLRRTKESAFFTLHGQFSSLSP